MNDYIICDARTGYMPGLLTPLFRSKREELRWKVRYLTLSGLDRETRQAMAADPAIVWDAEVRQYRRRRKSDPPRVEPIAQYLDPADNGDATPHPREGAGGSERICGPTLQTGAGQELNCKHPIWSPL